VRERRKKKYLTLLASPEEELTSTGKSPKNRRKQMLKQRFTLATLGVALFCAQAAWAQPAKNPEEDVLLKRTEAFVATFNKGDAKALADFFSTDGDMVDPEGQHIKGRKAIEEVYQHYFAATKGARLFIHITSVRVVRPDLAFEDGLTEVVRPDGPPSAARYTVIYVKKDGQWYLESVREAIAVPPSNSKHLQDLAFLIGDWTEDVDKGGAAKASYSLAAQGNFLVNTFDLTMQDVSIAGGVQWIGWDAAGKQARSWVFLFNGGFAEAVWAKDGNTWKSALTATMRDGKKMTATNVLTKIDADHFSVQFIDRKLDGQPLPDEKAVKMKRVQ
jgi:uncharacterized protein (TIGR02246 family)